MGGLLIKSLLYRGETGLVVLFDVVWVLKQEEWAGCYSEVGAVTEEEVSQARHPLWCAVHPGQ